LTACVTSAHVHGSQPAIPMEKLTEQKVQFGYSVTDTGYGAKTIHVDLDSFRIALKISL
jgi:hypothetical protein